jgi:hypothetical protein
MKQTWWEQRDKQYEWREKNRDEYLKYQREYHREYRQTARYKKWRKDYEQTSVKYKQMRARMEGRDYNE